MTRWIVSISIFLFTLCYAADNSDTKTKTETKEKVKTERVETKSPSTTPQEAKVESGGEDPFKAFESTKGYESTFIRTMVILLCILILVGLAVWMFRRLSHARIRTMNFHKSIKVIEKRPISPKSILYLIEIGGRQILIGESQLELREITTLDFPKDLTD